MNKIGRALTSALFGVLLLLPGAPSHAVTTLLVKDGGGTAPGTSGIQWQSNFSSADCLNGHVLLIQSSAGNTTYTHLSSPSDSPVGGGFWQWVPGAVLGFASANESAQLACANSYFEPYDIRSYMSLAVQVNLTPVPYPPSCTGVTVSAPSVVFGSAPTVSVNVNGLGNGATGAYARVYGAWNGQDDKVDYQLTGTLPDVAGAITLANHAVGAPQYGVVTVEAHAVKGAQDNICSTTTFLLRPGAAPTMFKATDGTKLDKVGLNWSAVAGISNYQVVECPNVAGEPTWSGANNTGTPMVAGQACTNVGTPVAGGVSEVAVPGALHEVHKYAVYGITPDGTMNTPLSLSDTGYPDRPPTAAVINATAYVGDVSLPLTATVTDPNPGDVFTYGPAYTVGSLGGTVTASGRLMNYTPPTTSGTDTFTFTAIDAAGASVSGTGTVVVSCKAPSATGVQALPGQPFVSAGFRVRGNYNLNRCLDPMEGQFEVRDGGGTVVLSSAVQTLNATGQTQADLAGLGVAGTYTVSFKVRNTVTGESDVSTAQITVNPVVLPQVTVGPNVKLPNLTTVQVAFASMQGCSMTADDALAKADVSRCLVEPAGPVAQLPLTAGTGMVWSGVPTVAGSIPLAFNISQYDYQGNKHQLGTVSPTVEVQDYSSIVVSAPTSLTGKRSQDLFIAELEQTGTACPFEADAAAATAAGAAGTLKCKYTITAPVASLQAYTPGVKGRIHVPNPGDISWSVVVYDRTGATHPIGSGTVSLTVTDPVLTYSMISSPSTPTALVTTFIGTVVSGTNNGCQVTNNAGQAASSDGRMCLLEWGALPAGIAQPSTGTYPSLQGRLPVEGVNTFPYTVSFVDAEGTKYPLGSGSVSLTALAAPTPTVDLSNYKELAQDVYATSVDGSVFALLSNCTNCGAVVSTVTVGAGAPQSSSMISASAKLQLKAPAGALYSEQTATARVALAAAPERYAEKAFKVVSVPPDDVKVMLDIPSADAPDNSPFHVKVRLGTFGATGFAYNASRLGQWSVMIGNQDASGNITPLASNNLTDASGMAQADLNLSNMVIARLVAVATPVSPYPTYARTVQSVLRVVRVAKGAPVTGQLLAEGLSGPSPLMTVLKVKYDTRADQLANDSLTWLMSSDGGASWQPITGATGGQYVMRSSTGSRMVKVGFHNKNSDVRSETAAVTLLAYDVPTVTITGNRATYPGASVSLSAAALDPTTNAAVPGAVYDWVATYKTNTGTVSTAASGTGSTASFTPTEVGAYTLTYKARMPQTSAADPRAWGTARAVVMSVGPTKTGVKVAGPSRLEVGKSYTFNGVVTTDFSLSSSPLTVAGFWTLPSGATVNGTALNWTPTPADLASGAVKKLTYTAWVDGYEASTKSSTAVTVQLWEYKWPTWSAKAVLTTTFAPANLSVTVSASDPTLVAGVEGLHFTWTVPAGIDYVGTPTSRLNATINNTVNANVTVVVADSRGHTQTMSVPVVVAQPSPVTLSFTTANMSAWTHAPLTLGLTGKTTGGHPLDSIKTWEYTLDGNPLTLPSLNTARIVIADPGAHTVVGTITTKMGATAQQTINVVVPANVPASCTLAGTPAANRTSIALKATCTDSDGRISKYRWFINGTPVTLSVGAVWTAMLKPDQWPVTVSLEVTDDGGAISTAQSTFN